MRGSPASFRCAPRPWLVARPLAHSHAAGHQGSLCCKGRDERFQRPCTIHPPLICFTSTASRAGPTCRGNRMEGGEFMSTQFIVMQSCDWWVCLCGNEPNQDGFFPCDELG